MVDDVSIFGRDAEITEVIDFLLSEKEKEKLFSVISIVGKGGIGKTTIAQLVYKDRMVSRCFDLFGWVCVSEEFDVGILTKAIIESVFKINYNLSELSSLQEKLAETVKEKTILLVLDDVWNENQSLWELFQIPFREAKLVRIIMTTRNKKVARVMQTTMLVRPSNLSEDACWQLFQHYAIGTRDTVPTHLVDMGKNIMRKCGGLPLVVKSIASLLRHETDEKSWIEILESDLWESIPSNDIFSALQISYAHLPAHLKPCFLLCSMYPKDYLLEKMHLIKLWISHGYIQSKGKRRIIEIGAEYYEELKERSFLDDFSDNYLDKALECCKLHDIIHDLARLNSENEHYSVEINQPLDKQEGMREPYHLFISSSVGYVNQILQQNEHNLKGLRTLSTDLRGQDNIAICNLTKFGALRVLELKGIFTKVPDFIPELKHIVYLSITSVNIKMLSLSIGRLYNLQNLFLDCPLLKYLPENIGDLANLQFLYIQYGQIVHKKKSWMGSLASYNVTFYVTPGYVPHGHVNFLAIKKMNAWLRVRNIGWLKDMKDLEGKLSIEGLVNMSNLLDAERANLRNKCKLEALNLCWNDDSNCDFLPVWKHDLRLSLIPEACEDGLVRAGDFDISLLECLQPHTNLKNLSVKMYPSAKVPRWMRDPLSLQSIQEVRLEYCYYIDSLPFDNLYTLKKLIIHACYSFQVLQLEQLPSQLEKLQIYNCGRLELITGLGDLDMLASLRIHCCRFLKSLTMDRLQLAESSKLSDDSSHEKTHTGRQIISSLTTLEIEYCGLLSALPDGLIPRGPSCYVRVQGCGFPDLQFGHQP